MKAIGYTRVSTEEQEREGVSLAAQADKVRKYAEWKGLDCELMIEEPVSGSTSLLSRPKGNALLSMIEDGKVTDIICTRLDRLFRDLRHCVCLLEEWEDSVVLHLVDEGGVIDTSTPDGYLNVMIKALFAAVEVRTIRLRTRTALTHKKDSGQVYNHTPYGYDAKDGLLEENKVEQVVIEKMTNWRNEGWSFQEIADHLNGISVPAKKGGKWHPQSVKNTIMLSAHFKGGEG